MGWGYVWGFLLEEGCRMVGVLLVGSVCVCLCDAGWVSVCASTSLGATRLRISVFLYGGCVLLMLRVLYYTGIEYE